MNDEYVVFILSHGRPNSVNTYNSLREYGYTGLIKIICDNEDPCLHEYVSKYGSEVIVFDKAEIAGRIDVADNFKKRNSVVYARNAVYEIAKNIGYRWFVQLDDDYTGYGYRISKRNLLIDKKIKNLDLIFGFYFDFLKLSNSAVVAMAQSGDFLGGSDSSFIKGSVNGLRKTMNSFFCDSDKPVRFVSRMNDDVSTYVLHGSVGNVMIQCPYAAIKQKQTQKNSGGLTEMYLEFGTYVKSFYTVMIHPSSVVVSALNSSHPRLHHKIKWNMTVPKIIRESHRRS